MKLEKCGFIPRHVWQWQLCAWYYDLSIWHQFPSSTEVIETKYL